MSINTRRKNSATVLVGSPLPEVDTYKMSSGINSAHAPVGNNSNNKSNQQTILQKQRSTTQVQSLGMGSKKASLYLSRTTSLIKPTPGHGVRQSADGRDHDNSAMTSEDNSSVLSSKTVSVSSLERQFTFTGYDIMADEEPEEKVDEDEEETEKRTNVQNYISACKMLGHNPVTYVAKHINDKNIVMKSHPLGPDGVRAVCIAMVENNRIHTLDLEDNDIGPDGAVSVADMLRKNESITELRLAENLIGTRGIFAFSELLKDGKHLHTLDLTGSNLEDSDAKYVADMIEFNSHLKVLNVRHNHLGDEGGFDIGRAIAINDTLQELDISWNHIRGKGAIAVAIGVQKNVSLKKLNISWNGLATEGSMGMGRALTENRTLRELDISNNRIGKDAVGHIMKGLQENDGLSILRMGQNPYSPEVAMTILKVIEQSDKCVLTTLDLNDIVVRSEFLKTWDEIKAKRSLPLRIVFGAVVKGIYEQQKDPNAIDWRDPVVRLFKYMQDEGYRVIDLLNRLDKDKSFSVDRQEFKLGLMAENIPLTEAQLDDVIERLDKDGDGEVDLGELISAEKEYRRKMHLRMRKLLKQGPTVDRSLQKLMKIDEL